MVFGIAFLAGIARAIASVGGALIIQICWVLVWYLGIGTGSMKDAAGLVICFNTSAVIQAWLLREHVDWPFVVVVATPWIVLDILGTELLIVHDASPWLKRGFGLVLVAILLLEVHSRGKGPTVTGERHKSKPVMMGHVIVQDSSCVDEHNADPVDVRVVKQDECSGQRCSGQTGQGSMALETQVFDMRRRQSILWALFLGICGGILNGVFTVPLPAYFIFVFLSGIQKDKWRASQVSVQLMALPSKSYYYFVVRQQYDSSWVLIYAAAVVGAAASLPIGNRLAAHVSQDVFKRIVFGMTFVGAWTMCLAGTMWAPWCAFSVFWSWIIYELWGFLAGGGCIVMRSVPNTLEEDQHEPEPQDVSESLKPP